jgi:hypothetical protein
MNRVLLLGNIRPSLRLGLALLLALALLGSPLAATPAAAAEKPSDNQYKERDNGNDNDDDNDNDNNRHHKKKNNNRNNNNNGGGGGAFEISEESEQEAESADINQSFTVESTGDNSTQCAGLQGLANSGNPQNLFDFSQVNSEADDVEAEEVGSTIDESPESSTNCGQQVSQAASAAADPPSCTWWVDSYGVDVCTWSADGTYWTTDYYGNWQPYAGWTTAASKVATGALGTAGGLTTLGALATLGLVGTGLVIRRTRSD